MDYSLPGSSDRGIPQARILEWIAMSSSRGSFRPRDRTQISCNSCFGRQIHSPLSHVGSPWMVLYRDPVPIFCMWIFSFSWREKWEPIPVFLPREFHGQRSLSGCSPWGCKELDMTEVATQQQLVHQTSVYWRNDEETPCFGCVFYWWYVDGMFFLSASCVPDSCIF